MITLLNLVLPDALIERVRRNFAEAIAELQKSLLASGNVITLELLDGVETTVAHGLGRRPRWIKESCVRNATSVGRVEEVRDGSLDRTLYLKIKAIGYGGAVSVDLLVL